MSEELLYEYFKALVKANSVMKLFHIGYVEELNLELLPSLYKTGQKKEYPALVLVPPVSQPVPGSDGWERYNLNLFFMDTVQIKNDLSTKVEKGEATWLRMAQTAWDFYLQFKADTEKLGLTDKILFVDEAGAVKVDRVKEFLSDRLAGARLDLALMLYRGCEPVSTFNPITFDGTKFVVTNV